MASYTITIPDNIVSRVIDGIAYQHKYQDEIDDPSTPGEVIPNPESKVAFAKRMNKRWIRENVKAWETNLAKATAGEQAASENQPQANRNRQGLDRQNQCKYRRKQYSLEYQCRN